MMLNQTTWVQAEPILEKIFKKWPNPGCLSFPEHDLTEFADIGIWPTISDVEEKEAYDYHRRSVLNELEIILKPLGLHKTRAKRLMKMSEQYCQLMSKGIDNIDVISLTGCGQYAVDAWKLFVLKEPCNPSDRLLRKYAERRGLLRK